MNIERRREIILQYQLAKMSCMARGRRSQAWEETCWRGGWESLIGWEGMIVVIIILLVESRGVGRTRSDKVSWMGGTMKLNWLTGVWAAQQRAQVGQISAYIVQPYLFSSFLCALDQRSPTSCPSCPSPMEHSSLCMYLSAFLLDSLPLHVHAVVLMLLQACTLFTMDYQVHHGSVAMYTLQKSIINGIALLLFIVVHTLTTLCRLLLFGVWGGIDNSM